MGQISINNVKINGHSIVINNGIISIDGNKIDIKENEKIINITADNIHSLQVDNCNSITVNGDTGSVDVSQGKVSIGGAVKGNVKVSQGNVDCGNVDGDIKVSMGNINSRH